MNIKEDLRDWLVDNWIAIEDSVDSVLTSCNKEFLMKGERFELSNVVDRDNLVNKIAENLKTGILNVVDTYEEPKHEWIRAEEDLPGPFSTVILDEMTERGLTIEVLEEVMQRIKKVFRANAILPQRLEPCQPCSSRDGNCDNTKSNHQKSESDI